MTKGIVWLVGGGIMQESMAETVLNTKHDLFITDGDAQCFLARKYAGNLRIKMAVMDTYDERGHLKLLHEHEDKARRDDIVAVLTDSADVGPTVSLLAEVLGLPAASYVGARNARDKASMRRLVDPGVLGHPVYLVANWNEKPDTVLARWLNRAKSCSVDAFPVVVKPADNSASRGISIVRSESTLVAALAKAAENLKYSNNVLLEEYVPGEEYATDWLIMPDYAMFINGCRRYFDEFGLEAGHVNLPRRDFPGNLHEIAWKTALALGVTEGPFKMDLTKHEDYGWLVIETATRWSGGFDHDYTGKLAKGYSPDTLLLQYALGKKDLVWPGWMQDFKETTKAAAYAPRVPGHMVVNEEMRTALLRQPGIKQVIITKPGIGNPQLRSCADRQLFILGTDPDDPWTVTKDAWSKYVGDV